LSGGASFDTDSHLGLVPADHLHSARNPARACSLDELRLSTGRKLLVVALAQRCSLRRSTTPSTPIGSCGALAVTVTLPKDDAHALSRSLPHAPAAVRLRYTDSSCSSS
jgi:hypothetical protein